MLNEIESKLPPKKKEIRKLSDKMGEPTANSSVATSSAMNSSAVNSSAVNSPAVNISTANNAIRTDVLQRKLFFEIFKQTTVEKK